MTDSPKLRELRFESIDDVVAEAERLASVEVETTGNCSLGQILEHLARTMDVVTGNVSAPPVPFPMRLMARAMRPLILSRPMRPGFKLPTKAQSVFWPAGDVDVSQALAHFKEAAERYKATDPLPRHPFFGKMSRAQHDDLALRHSALHLGFVHPCEGGQSE